MSPPGLYPSPIHVPCLYSQVLPDIQKPTGQTHSLERVQACLPPCPAYLVNPFQAVGTGESREQPAGRNLIHRPSLTRNFRYKVTKNDDRTWAESQRESGTHPPGVSLPSSAQQLQEQALRQRHEQPPEQAVHRGAMSLDSSKQMGCL